MASGHRLTVEVSDPVFEELVRLADGAPEPYLRRLVEEDIARRGARERREALMAERARECADMDLAICKEFGAADDELWIRMGAGQAVGCASALR